MILAVGILSLLLCGLLGPVAWIMGSNHIKHCRRYRIRPDGSAQAGYYLGIIGTLLLVISLIYLVIVGIIAYKTAAL